MAAGRPPFFQNKNRGRKTGPHALLVHTVQQALKALVGAPGLLQLCVFRFGFLQDGDVGVGVFPQIEEILVGGAGLGEGVRLWRGQPAPIRRGVACGAPVVSRRPGGRATCAGFECIGPAQAEVGQRAQWTIHHQAGMVEDFLKFGRGLFTLAQCQVSLAACT